jgi:hypothetical protein
MASNANTQENTASPAGFWQRLWQRIRGWGKRQQTCCGSAAQSSPPASADKAAQQQKAAA